MKTRLDFIKKLQFYNNQKDYMQKRWFFLQHILWCLLVLRPFYYQSIRLELFTALVGLIFILKYVVEGFTIITLVLVLLFKIGIAAQVGHILPLQYLTALIVGLLAYFPVKVYWLPESPKPVGFREDSLQNGLHYFEFYPLQSQKPVTFRSIKWNYSKEISKMVQYQNVSNKLLKKLSHLVLSYADKYKLKIADGTQQATENGMALSHGKGGTPFYYSSLMMNFASEGYKVGAVQHTQISRLNLDDKDQIKKFRGKEVIKRAEEYVLAINKLKTKNIVLIAHSYGCATLIQAYHTLDETTKSKIEKIVLLDPWFFALEQSIFSKEIKSKILILANEDFLGNQLIYQLNNQFINIHKVEYIVWKDGHHLHQTDSAFVSGNILGVIKNSALSKQMLELNINAIDKFLKGHAVESAFGEKNLGRSFKPGKFHPVNPRTW